MARDAASRKLWSRTRVCASCGKAEEVRRDNAAARCRPCASREVAATRRPPALPSVARPKRGGGVSLVCSACAAPFRVSPSEAPGRLYCTQACRIEAGRIARVCKECGSGFSVLRSALSGRTNASGNFCSRPCYHRWLSRTPHVPKRGTRWGAARRAALAANPFCAMCGTMRRLDVHHVVPFRLTQDNAQANLIPLCKRHHKAVEGMFAEIERDVAGDLGVARLVLGTMLRERQDMARMALREAIRAAGG